MLVVVLVDVVCSILVCYVCARVLSLVVVLSRGWVVATLLNNFDESGTGFDDFVPFVFK